MIDAPNAPSHSNAWRIVKRSRLWIALTLGMMLVLSYLGGLGTPRASADSGPGSAAQSSSVGINGAACAYNTINIAEDNASDGDTIYVDVSQIHTGGVIGLLDKNVTLAAAGNNCQSLTDTLAIVDGGGQQWYTFGGMGAIAGGTTVTFANMKVQNTHAYRGGILFVRQNGKLVLEGSQLISGTAQVEGGAVHVSQGGTLRMTDGSAIYSNEVTETFGTGAGVSVELGSMTMVDSFVGGDPFNVSANTGGGVTLETSDLYLYDSFILNNIAVNEGGGVYAFDRSIVELHGVSAIGFPAGLGNRAHDGAGLYLSGQTTLDLYGESVVGYNGANEFGGGLYATDESVATLHDADTGIYSNTARFGGGAYVTGSNSSLILQDGSVEGNQALDPSGVANGGGAYVTGEALIYAGEADIVRNYAEFFGGGVYIGQDGVTGPTDLLFANGTRVESNYAEFGGGLYLAEDGSRATLDEAELQANVAFTTGGAIRVFGDSQVTVKNGTLISGNVATQGGGLAIRDGSVEVPFSTVYANEAIENGGGIYQTGGDLSGFETLILGNQAEEGGGLYLEGATAVLTSVEVTENSAGRVGGGIAAAANSELHMTADLACLSNPYGLLRHRYCSEVGYNDAQTQGAGVYVEGSTAHFTTTAFFGNEGQTNAGASGAALYAGPFADVSAVSALFTNNSANNNVAVYVEQDGNLVSDNSTYAGNQDTPLFVHSGGSASLNRNILWDNANPADIRGTITSYCNDTQTTHPSLPSNKANISQDPKFVVTARGPYRLGTGSPAIDACAPGIAERGLDGRPRGIMILSGHTLENYDMGAFEMPVRLFVPLVLRNYSTP